MFENVVELRFGENLDHALRGAAERERIFRTRRHHADPETLAQRVELVGERDDLALRCFGDRILHAERLVVLIDRPRDGFGFALSAGVEAAD